MYEDDGTCWHMRLDWLILECYSRIIEGRWRKMRGISREMPLNI